MNDHQLRELLGSRDPAGSLEPAGPERVDRLVQDAMSRDVETPAAQSAHPEADPRRRTPLTWLVAAAAVLVIAGVGLFVLLGDLLGDDGEPTASPPRVHSARDTVLHLAAPAPTRGRCAMVSVRLMARQQTAFDGTVTAVDDRRVTLSVTHWYRGGDADQVTIRSAPPELQALLQAAAFEEGGRFLVSASDGTVSVCGYTAPYSDRLAAVYSEAFAP